MSQGYKIADQYGLYYLTFQVVDWVDIFTRKIYRDIIIDSFQYIIENKGFQLFGYVIMSNHIHLIANNRFGKLSENIRDFKKFTSVKIVNTIHEIDESRRMWIIERFQVNASQRKTNKIHQVWTHENHPVLLYSDKFIKEKLDYIHKNPVRAGIVETPEDYMYSSARNYASLPAPIKIQLLFITWNTVH